MRTAVGLSKRRGAWVAGFAVVVALLALAACGGDGDGGSEVDGPTPAAPSEGPASGAARLCASGFASDVTATVASPELIEISGLAASRRNEGVLWAHNDSGDTARVFAVGTAGEHLGAFSLAGAQAVDWEDMALGPGPQEGIDYLYLGDIGDNGEQRSEIVVYRVPEPDVTSGGTPATSDRPGVETLTLRYPDRAHDAETLLVDPVDGDLLIVTKEVSGSNALVFRAPPALAAGSTTTLEQVGAIDFRSLPARPLPLSPPTFVAGLGHLPTGGDVSPEGDVVAIRTYSTVWLWERPEGAPLWEAFTSTPCEGPSAVEPQGEAVAFLADGSGYVTVSEGANPPIHRFGE